MCDQGGRGDLMRFAFWHNNSDFSIKKKKEVGGVQTCSKETSFKRFK